MSDQDGRKLAQAYMAGATIRELAQMQGASYSTVRTKLLVSQVPLRRRGGDRRSPAARAAAAAHGGLTGEAGAERYRQAVASGDIPAPGTPSSRGPGRRARPPAVEPSEWGGTPSPAPRAAGRRSEAVDDELVELIATQASQLLAQRGLQEAVEQLSDDEVWAAMLELRIALDGGRGAVADTGSTRGVRRRPDATTERF